MHVNWETWVTDFFVYGFFLYSVSLLLGYLLISIFSLSELSLYLKKNKGVDYKILAPSLQTPSISLLAPAFNESKTIVENVKSLMAIYYSELQVIVINDGSSDDSMQKLIAAYDLVMEEVYFPPILACKPVKGIYKSTNPAYNRLTIIDKENGGKADSLNAGINLANGDLIVCADVDCILEQDAISKIVKPFLERSDVKVIAAGGVIRVANSCEINHGKLVRVHLPKQLLPLLQTLEYIRAFLLGRMAWSRLNGLMLISGAFGAFDKSVVIACNGYSTKTVGEDMELVVRMRKYMHSINVKYSVTYIPDPLCWTEVPSTVSGFGKQRNRWLRGTVETLREHKNLFFNYKYGLMGLVSYPYWFFFEMMAGPIEFIGLLFFTLMALLGEVNWDVFIYFFGFIWSFSFLFSLFAILMESATFNQYKERGDTIKLILAAMVEPFIYHPIVVWSAINGFADYFKNINVWGGNVRKGFSLKSHLAIKESGSFLNYLKNSLNVFIPLFFVISGLLLLGRTYELVNGIQQSSNIGNTWNFVYNIILSDVYFLAQVGGFLFIVYLLFGFLNKVLAKVMVLLIGFCFILGSFLLSKYFLTTLTPLGSDLWGYSLAEIKQTVGASGAASSWTMLLILCFILLVLLALILLPKKIAITYNKSWRAFFILMAVFFIQYLFPFKPHHLESDFIQNLSLNKEQIFIGSSYHYFFPKKSITTIYDDLYSGDFGQGKDTSNVSFQYTDPQAFPFLHQSDTSYDVLSPFIKQGSVSPNIVLVLVEGLGRAFTNKGAYLGNFTPFIDSLSEKSLYWPNFLSQGGRTFAVLPSVLGSAPFAKNGFSELGDKMPEHFSLINLLKKQGYHSAFFYGGETGFDNMGTYLKKNQIDQIVDENAFGSGYTKMPASSSGFSWGYGDQELFRNYFSKINAFAKQPYLSIVLTVSTHSPFLINQQERYLQKFEQQLTTLGFSDAQKKEYRKYSMQYASILFLDDALKGFFDEYKKRPDFANTVFLITGDHRMPEIPMSTKIDRYHVPLLIYSPLLKRTAQFGAVSTHFDILPSLTQWLHHAYQFPLPEQTSWVGYGLDTMRTFRSNRAYPFMQTKNEVNSFLFGNYFVDGKQVFLLGNNMDLSIEEDEKDLQMVLGNFNNFKSRNELFIKTNRLVPESLLNKYLK